MYGYFLKQHNIRKVIIIKIFSRRKTLAVTYAIIKPDKHFRETLWFDPLFGLNGYVYIIQYKTIPWLLFQHDGD